MDAPCSTIRSCRAAASWGSGLRQAEWSWADNIPSIEINIRGIIVNRMKGAEPSKDALTDAGKRDLVAFLRAL